MIEHEIVRCSVNPSLTLPDAASIDETKLMELSVRHRTHQRLLGRIQREHRRPCWCSAMFLVKLRAPQFRDLERMRAVVSEAHLLTALIPAGGKPLIFAKGFATYALTGDRRYLHYYSDLDIFADDLPRLWDDVRAKLGYRGDRHYTHEYAKGVRKHSALDLHSYLPVLSLKASEAYRQQEVSAAANPAHWKLPAATTHETRIGYDDLLPHCTVCGSETAACGLLVPELTITAFLSCVNLHRDYVRLLHYFGHDQLFRLGSLADIQDLACNSQFDAGKFRDWVSRWNAEDAIALTAELSERFLGRNYLPTEDKLRHFVAEELFWGGLVIPDNGQSLDDVLLVRDMAIVLQRLGVNDVSASGSVEDSPQTYVTTDVACTSKGDSENTRLPRVIWRGRGTLPFLFYFAWDADDHLTLEFRLVAEASFGSAYELMVHLGDDSYVLVRLESNGKSDILKQRREPAAPFGSVSLVELPTESLGEERLSLGCRLTWTSDFASSADGETGVLYAMIAVNRLSPETAETPMGEPQRRGLAADDVTYVPLRIHRSVGAPVAVL